MAEQLERLVALRSELEDLRDAADIAEGLPRRERPATPGSHAPTGLDGGPGWTEHVASIELHSDGTRVAMVLRRRYRAHLGKVRTVRGRRITINEQGKVARGADWRKGDPFVRVRA